MSPSVSGDAELLHRYIRSGDPDAFAGLVRAHQDMVYATCLRVLADAHEAEDVAQEVFVLLARHGAAIRDHIGGWLHATAHREAIERGIRRRNAREREAAWAAEQMAVRAGTAASAGADLLRHIDEALAELPAADRDLLVRHYLEGVPQTELAVATGLHQSAISRRLRDAVARLRAILRRRGVPAPGLALLGSEAFRLPAPPGVAAKAIAAGLGGVGVANGGVRSARWAAMAGAAGAAIILAGGWWLAVRAPDAGSPSMSGSAPLHAGQSRLDDPPLASSSAAAQASPSSASPASASASTPSMMPVGDARRADQAEAADGPVLVLPCAWEADAPLPGLETWRVTAPSEAAGTRIQQQAYPIERIEPAFVPDAAGLHVLQLQPARPVRADEEPMSLLLARLPLDADRVGIRMRMRVIAGSSATYGFSVGAFFDALSHPGPPGANHVGLVEDRIKVIQPVSAERWFTLSSFFERTPSGSTITNWIDGRWYSTHSGPRRYAMIGLAGISRAQLHVDRLRIWRMPEGELFDPRARLPAGPSPE